MNKQHHEMPYARDPEEERLVDGCLQGSQLQQKRLYEKYYGKMLGICLRYAASRDEAKDVLQEGFIKVFQNLQGFSFQCPLEAWIRRIMVNTAIDSYRKTSSQPYAFDIDDAHSLHTNEDILSDLGHKELLACLQQLPPGYRVVFNLYIIEGYSHKEIAEQLQISEGTSKSQLAKARVYLQKIVVKQFAIKNEQSTVTNR